MSTPRKAFILTGVAALLLLIGYALGRFAVPARVEQQVVTVDKVRMQLVVHEVTVDHTVRVQTSERDDQKEKVETFERTKAPDGTVIEKGQIVWRSRDQESQTTKLSLDVAKTVDVNQTVAIDHRAESKTIVTNVPRWTVGVGVGAALSFVPLSAAPVYTLFGSYRIAGPFSVGLWASAQQPKTITDLRLEVGAYGLISF